MNLQERFAKHKNYRSFLQEEQQVAKETLAKLSDKKETMEAVQKICQDLAEYIQGQLSYQLTELVNNALRDIFTEEELEFTLEFDQNRGKIGVSFYVLSHGHKINIYDACGGGLADIVSFALRVILLILKGGRRVLLLDEPFKNLDTGKKPIAANFLSEVSNALGIQIIIITHEDDYITQADKVFFVSKNKNGISQVHERA